MVPQESSGAPPALRFAGAAIAVPLAGGGTYQIVAPLDLAIAQNSFVAIIGPTGCGKTTLLNAAAGLIEPATGDVLLHGARRTGLNRRAGYLFQQDALMPWKTALDNVAVALAAEGVPRRDAREKARNWLARVGLAAFADRYPHMLSGGQRKRVALAQMLIRDPDLLLMDEPFGPLDAQTREIMGNLLLKLWDGGKTVLFVTHDLDEAIALADRVIVMSAGPAATVVADVPIDLPRPRDISEIRLLPAFHALHAKIWDVLRGEVRKTYVEVDA